jgi:hypothetical protein
METNLVSARRVIYLTIMNVLNYEEAVHKLLKQIDGPGGTQHLFSVVFSY